MQDLLDTIEARVPVSETRSATLSGRVRWRQAGQSLSNGRVRSSFSAVRTADDPLTEP